MIIKVTYRISLILCVLSSGAAAQVTWTNKTDYTELPYPTIGYSDPTAGRQYRWDVWAKWEGDPRSIALGTLPRWQSELCLSPAVATLDVMRSVAFWEHVSAVRPEGNTGTYVEIFARVSTNYSYYYAGQNMMTLRVAGLPEGPVRITALGIWSVNGPWTGVPPNPWNGAIPVQLPAAAPPEITGTSGSYVVVEGEGVTSTWAITTGPGDAGQHELYRRLGDAGAWTSVGFVEADDSQTVSWSEADTTTPEPVYWRVGEEGDIYGPTYAQPPAELGQVAAIAYTTQGWLGRSVRVTWSLPANWQEDRGDVDRIYVSLYPDDWAPGGEASDWWLSDYTPEVAWVLSPTRANPRYTVQECDDEDSVLHEYQATVLYSLSAPIPWLTGSYAVVTGNSVEITLDTTIAGTSYSEITGEAMWSGEQYTYEAPSLPNTWSWALPTQLPDPPHQWAVLWSTQDAPDGAEPYTAYTGRQEWTLSLGTNGTLPLPGDPGEPGEELPDPDPDPDDTDPGGWLRGLGSSIAALGQQIAGIPAAIIGGLQDWAEELWGYVWPREEQRAVLLERTAAAWATLTQPYRDAWTWIASGARILYAMLPLSDPIPATAGTGWGLDHGPDVVVSIPTQVGGMPVLDWAVRRAEPSTAYTPLPGNTVGAALEMPLWPYQLRPTRAPITGESYGSRYGPAHVMGTTDERHAGHACLSYRRALFGERIELDRGVAGEYYTVGARIRGAVYPWSPLMLVAAALVLAWRATRPPDAAPAQEGGTA